MRFSFAFFGHSECYQDFSSVNRNSGIRSAKQRLPMPTIPIRSTPIAVLLLCTSLLGQSPASPDRPRTVRVQGLIQSTNDSVVPGTEVVFHGEQVSRTVISDDKGFYQIDLPAGLYTMTAVRLGYSSLQKYSRPLFRIGSQPTFLLNITLYAERCCCDIVERPGAEQTPEQLENIEKNACGGEDSFPLPSEDGVQFQVYLRYPKRALTDRGYVYKGDQISTNSGAPARVEYNLFTLEAEQILYDAEHQKLEAAGHVVVTDESGKSQNANSMIFKLENGHVKQAR